MNAHVSMKSINVGSIARFWRALCLLAGLALLAGCTKGLPDDGANAKPAHFDNMSRVRYIEILVFGGDPVEGQLRANVYNSSLMHGFDPAKEKDSAPQAYVEGINLEDIKKQYGALAASINGPKLWMPDWFDIPLGAERDFNGKLIPWCAALRLKKEELKTMGKQGYVSTTIERKSKIGYNKGTLVFLIDDTSGNTWVMKGMEIGVKPQYTYEEFATNPEGRFKNLPPDWKFRTKVLDQDLILVPDSGVARIMPDEFFNVYDLTGPGYSNYKP